MRVASKPLLWALLLAPAAVPAQQGPGATTPRAAPAAADLEPAVNTSAEQPAVNAPPGPADTPAPASPAGPAAAAGPAQAPVSKRRQEVRPGAVKAPAAKSAPAMDRVDLGTTDITGNRELPNVTYIVPWKRSDLGDLAGKPVNSLVDEVLEPVDRSVFNRQNRYFDALTPRHGSLGAGAPGEGAQGSAAPGASPGGSTGTTPGTTPGTIPGAAVGPASGAAGATARGPG